MSKCARRSCGTRTRSGRQATSPSTEDLMFKVDVRGQLFALKSMNCPGHMLLFGSPPTQLQGAAAALFRGRVAAPRRAARDVARAATSPDRHPGRRAHLLHGKSRSRTRSRAVSSQAPLPVRALRLEGRAPVATRPDNKVGTDEQWDRNEAAHRGGAEAERDPVHHRAGRGAFYGPKIDLFMDDALGRKWQMGTIQLDSQMPSRFGLKYVGADNADTTSTSCTAPCTARSNASSAS